MQKELKRFGLGLVAVGLCLALVAGVCIPQVAKAQKKEVVIGIQGMVTGPSATAGVPLTEGWIDGLRYINEQGGINGVNIKIMWQDSRLEVPRIITAHKRFKDAGAVVQMGTIGTVFEMMVTLCPRDEIPAMMYDGFGEPAQWTEPLPWVFGVAPSWQTVAAAIGGWINSQWLKERTEEHPLRLASIIWDDVMARFMVEGLVAQAPIIGYEVVNREIIPRFGVLDTSTEWIRTFAKKPDWVYIHTIGQGQVVLIKDGYRLGTREKGIKLFCGTACIEESSARVIGEAAEGLYTALVSAVSTQTDLPMVRTINDWEERWRGHKPEDVSLLHFAGWATSLIAVEGVRLAIEKVGYENLSGPAVRDGLASITDFETGVMPTPVTMSNKKPWAVDKGWIFVIKDGRLWLVDEVPFDWYPEWLQEKIKKMGGE